MNSTASREAAGELRWEAVDDASGQVAHTFKPQTFRVAAGAAQTITLSDAWPDPKLWWPDTPNLYRLRSTIVVGGRAADVSETLFGCREWRREGTKFTLNGVVWHLWADFIGDMKSPQDWLAAYRRTNQRTTRLSTAGQAGHESRWLGTEPRDALEFCGRNGVVVRRNTTLDGETIGNAFSESDPETRKQQGGSLKRKFQDNVAALELLKQLEAEGRAATDREKRALVRFVGWGGLPQVFNLWNDEWNEQRERLEQLPTPEELESARASTLNAHYTAPVVIQALYAALQRPGFPQGRILEPALGLGHFIGLMPDELHSRSLVTGIEIDSITPRLGTNVATLPLAHQTSEAPAPFWCLVFPAGEGPADVPGQHCSS